jgi:hypothetical protein
MKKFLSFAVLTFFWMLILFPKDILWKIVVAQLQKQDIVVKAHKLNDKLYKIDLSNIEIFYHNIKISDIKKMTLKPWLFYNEIDVNGIEPDKKNPLFKNIEITKAKTVYTILHPKYIKITGKSNMGDFESNIDIFLHRGYFRIKNKNIKNFIFKRYFKKDEQGMKYEFTF